MKELQKFVDTYEKYYFDDLKSEDKKTGNDLGVTITHPVSREFEALVMSCLAKDQQSIDTIAWKLGMQYKDGDLKDRYHTFPIEKVKKYINETAKLDLLFESELDIRKSYDEVLSVVSDLELTGYGSVYIISSLFFLSKGKIPIYDYYAHVAVKALLDKINPQEVYVGAVPTKDQCSIGDKSNKSAVNLLLEYQRQLKDLAEGTEHFKTDEGMYISRQLDRALWVYGHAKEKWGEKK